MTDVRDAPVEQAALLAIMREALAQGTIADLSGRTLGEVDLQAAYAELGPLPALALREATFSRAISFDDLTLEAGSDFSNAVIAAGSTFRNSVFAADVEFVSARFVSSPLPESGAGDRHLAPVAAAGAAGPGSVDFEGAEFKGRAAFSGARFDAHASFDRVMFRGDAAFDGCAFAGSVTFRASRFNEHATFLESEFGLRATSLAVKLSPLRTTEDVAAFDATRFQGDVMFGAAVLRCDASFVEAFFGRQAYFERSRFLAAALFHPVTFAGAARFASTRFAGRVLFSGPGASAVDLADADLTGADLTGAQLGQARVRGARFHDAVLHDADLGEVREALAGQFARADVTGAKLPAGILELKGLDYVAEASRHARALFVTLLLGCVYAWLTIANTSDLALLTNSGTSPLPIIQTAVPMAGFYLVAPALLLLFYVYFHLYMQRIWEALARLPARLPDGEPLQQHAYPWLLNGLVQAHFPMLRRNRTVQGAFENWISVLLAWLVVPFTVLLFWVGYLPRQDLIGTTTHSVLVALAVLTAATTYRLAAGTLKGEAWALAPVHASPRGQALRGGLRRALGYGAGFLVPALALVAATLHVVSDRGLDSGDAEAERWMESVNEGARTRIRLAVWLERGLLGRVVYADLERVGLSELPDEPAPDAGRPGFRTWLRRVRSPDLSRTSLRHAVLSEATLVGADLREADLHGALLVGVDARGALLVEASMRCSVLVTADLRGAHLSGADLRGAAVGGANLDHATLVQARLDGAGLSHAILFSADLRGASLREADLRGAELKGARLAGADLRGATGLGCPSLRAAADFAEAIRDPHLRCGARIPRAGPLSPVRSMPWRARIESIPLPIAVFGMDRIPLPAFLRSSSDGPCPDRR